MFGKPLPDGGTIGVVAAASPYEGKSDVLPRRRVVGGEGLPRQAGRGRLRDDDYVAGDRAAARRRPERALRRPRGGRRPGAQGGYGSAQMIPYLDFDVIAANPKPFVGYSDITALHVAIRQRTGLATLYGYGLAGVGDKDATAFSRDRLLAGAQTGAAPGRFRGTPTTRTCARSAAAR